MAAPLRYAPTVRIGFDASAMSPDHPPGVRRVVERSLAALEARGKHEVVRLAPPPGANQRTWRHKQLAGEVRSQGLIGLHSFVSAFARGGPGKRVQTIHEVPWKHGVTENAGWKHRYWARFGARRADAVITPTAFVARDLGLRTAQEGGKLFVVPWGVDERFTEEPPLGEVDEVLLERYRLPEGAFVLALGAVRAKKNLAGVLHGLARLKERGGPVPQLIVTGDDTPDLRRDLGLAQKLGLTRYVSTPGHIEDEHLPGVLRLAAAVVVLSHSEGFGLPALEAVACGTPVVVSANSAQAEVAGPDAFQVDATDPPSVADGLRAAIEAREDLRYVLAAHARAFTWDRTAAAIERVWESLA